MCKLEDMAWTCHSTNDYSNDDWSYVVNTGIPAMMEPWITENAKSNLLKHSDVPRRLRTTPRSRHGKQLR